SYTLVASTFEPFMFSRFKLRLELDGPFRLTAIPREGAGMRLRELHGRWVPNTDCAGGPVDQCYARNPRFLVRTDRETPVLARLQTPQAESLPLINVSVFAFDDAVLGSACASSGSYTNSPQGVATRLATIGRAGPAEYLVVASTWDHDIDASFVLYFYSEHPVDTMPATLASVYPHIAPGPHTDALTYKDAALSGKTLATHLKAQHQKASRALILGQGGAAWQHCTTAVAYCNLERLTGEYGEQQARQLCCRLWILYICVLSSLAEVAEEDGRLRTKGGVELAGFPATVRSVWDAIMAAFGGFAGNVDSEVLVPLVLLCLKLRDARTARDVVEAWLATLSEDTVYLLQSRGAMRQQQRSMAQASYLRVCELYTLHILPQLGDLSSAYEFLSVSTVVSEPAKDEFTKRLDALRNPPAPKRRSRPAAKKSRKPKAVEQPLLTTTKPVAHVAKSADVAKGELAVDAQPAVAAALSARSVRVGKHGARRGGVKSGALARRPRSTLGIAWQVVRRLVSRWGMTLFTLAVAMAVLRLVTQRIRLPQLFTAVYRKLWSTIKMGTQVTYI
ncbi:cysteine protease, partial [Coemansia sp. RSA 2702]